MQEFQFSEEQIMLRDMTRDFVNNEIKPIAAKIDAEEKIPKELIQKLGELGFLGVVFPEEYGGGGFGEVGYCLMQEEIARSAFDYQRNIESGDKIIVGVNKFTIDKENPVPGFKIDDSIRQLQTAKLAALKSKRDQVKVAECLSAIKAAASGTTNLMPLVVEAVETYCTLGEIADTLRQVYGEHR